MRDGKHPQRAAWKALAHMLIATALVYCLVVAAIFFLDPYGRSGFRPSNKVVNLPERLLMVSRAMDSTFNAAIVGNSTSIPLQPEMLNGLTGLRFVTLSMSGSQAQSAMTTARFFIGRHADAKALVIGMDDTWCGDAGDMNDVRPFPFWLYKSNLDYAIGLFATASLEELKTGLSKPVFNRLDGYHPFDAGFEAYFKREGLDRMREQLLQMKRPVQARFPKSFRFEPLGYLPQLIRETPASVSFVLLWTPRYKGLIPEPNSSAAETDAACKASYREAVASFPNIRIVDWSGADRPENLDADNFYEANHFRQPLARKIEAELGKAITRADVPKLSSDQLHPRKGDD